MAYAEHDRVMIMTPGSRLENRVGVVARKANRDKDVTVVVDGFPYLVDVSDLEPMA